MFWRLLKYLWPLYLLACGSSFYSDLCEEALDRQLMPRDPIARGLLDGLKVFDTTSDGLLVYPVANEEIFVRAYLRPGNETHYSRIVQCDLYKDVHRDTMVKRLTAGGRDPGRVNMPESCWVSAETIKLKADRDQAKRRFLVSGTRKSKETWRSLNSALNEAYKSDRLRALNSQIDDLVTADQKREYSTTWKIIHDLSGKNQRALLNNTIRSTKDMPLPAEQDLPIATDPPSLEETAKAVKELKRKKAAGMDAGITAEALQGGGTTIIKVLHEFCVEVYTTLVPPEQRFPYLVKSCLRLRFPSTEFDVPVEEAPPYHPITWLELARNIRDWTKDYLREALSDSEELTDSYTGPAPRPLRWTDLLHDGYRSVMDKIWSETPAAADDSTTDETPEIDPANPEPTRGVLTALCDLCTNLMNRLPPSYASANTDRPDAAAQDPDMDTDLAEGKAETKDGTLTSGHTYFWPWATSVDNGDDETPDPGTQEDSAEAGWSVPAWIDRIFQNPMTGQNSADPPVVLDDPP
ncbi:Hypp1810 [Branchiostoma lanceolatum]|uniref:Hypp1810 protein n=1 Tax=Branchiostoma lanceolatum TaxID=7740 RepID=A0A8K0EMD9_BRALA|nr:Hypp1810 [Branchiostoma lanceolatum]